MKVCITGGSGFIGRRMRQVLAHLGHDVVVLDRVADTSGFRTTERFVHGDVREEAICREAVAGCDRVLHLAANHSDFGISLQDYFAVNVNGMRALCQAVADVGITQLCFFSSVAVYGSDTRVRDETDVPRPEHAYGKSKLAAEEVVGQWAAAADDRAALIIRPTVVFGPESRANVYTLIRQIARRRYFPVGSGANYKSLAYVDNVVDATLHLWGVPRCDGASGKSHQGVFNYVDMPDMTVAELDRFIYHELGRTPPSFRLPLGFGMAAAWPLDMVARATGWNLPVTRARVAKLNAPTRFSATKVLATGFQPRITLAEGLRTTIQAMAQLAPNP